MGDWSDVTDLISQGISTAGSVAQVALKPPTYSSVSTPYGTSISAYGPMSGNSLFSGIGLGGSLTGSFSPILLLGGAVLLAVVLLKR